MGWFKFKTGDALKRLYFDMQKGQRRALAELFSHLAHWRLSDVRSEALPTIDRIYQHLTGAPYRIIQTMCEIEQKLHEFHKIHPSLLDLMALSALQHDDTMALKRLVDLGYRIHPIVGSSTLIYFAIAFEATQCLDYLLGHISLKHALRSKKILKYPLLITALQKTFKAMPEKDVIDLFEFLVEKKRSELARCVIHFIDPKERGRYLSDTLLKEAPEIFELIATADPDLKALVHHLLKKGEYESVEALLDYSPFSRPSIAELLGWHLSADDTGFLIEHLFRYQTDFSSQDLLAIAAMPYWHMMRFFLPDGRLQVKCGAHFFFIEKNDVLEVLARAQDPLLIEVLSAFDMTQEELKRRYPILDLSWLELKKAAQ